MTRFRSFTENMTFFPDFPALIAAVCPGMQLAPKREMAQRIGKQTAAGVFPCRRFPSVDLLICCRTFCTGT